MNEDLPPPLVPAEVDLRGLPSFMLNVERLLGSELWALTRSEPEAFRGATALWARAWQQVPAASLPNDDAILAAFAELTPTRFKKLRPLVTRGFTLCSDGRLYHHVLAADAIRAWGHKQKHQARRETDRARLERWRANRKMNDGETRDETPPETGDETRFERRKTSTITFNPPDPPLPSRRRKRSEEINEARRRQLAEIDELWAARCAEFSRTGAWDHRAWGAEPPRNGKVSGCRVPPLTLQRWQRNRGTGVAP